MKRNTPIDENVLDYLIVYHGISKGEGGRFSPENTKVIALYDYLGRWFSKDYIIERIDHFDELRSNGVGNRIPFFRDLNYLNGQLGEMALLSSRSSLLRKRYIDIDIDSEIMVEVNNMCSNMCSRRRKSPRVYHLLKHLIPKVELDDGFIYYSHAWFIVPYRPEELPLDMVWFWWKQDERLNAVCYRSTTENAFFKQAFNLDFVETGSYNLKHSGTLNKNTHLNDVLEYSGDDYVLVFRLEDDEIISGRPQPINHEYELKPIVPVDLLYADSRSVLEYHTMINKYYDLYHLRNKKAKQALQLSGFNLKAKDE